jgi:molecular chaperone DnaJ
MMFKNYYQILGLNEDASPQEIKSAYRRLAMEVHPDHSGSNCQPFQDIQEAYSVLSDPQRRSDYDRSRAQKIKVNRNQQHPYHKPYSTHQAEPLIPHHARHRTENLYNPPDYQGNDYDVEFPFSVFMHDFFNFIDLTSAGSQRHDHEIEVNLSSQQARRGGTIEIDLPITQTCPHCHGYGDTGFMPCRRCEGSGRISSAQPIRIDFPAGIEDGARRIIPLRETGLNNGRLILHFRIDRNL